MNKILSRDSSLAIYGHNSTVVEQSTVPVVGRSFLLWTSRNVDTTELRMSTYYELEAADHHEPDTQHPCSWTVPLYYGQKLLSLYSLITQVQSCNSYYIIPAAMHTQLLDYASPTTPCITLVIKLILK